MRRKYRPLKTGGTIAACLRRLAQDAQRLPAHRDQRERMLDRGMQVNNTFEENYVTDYATGYVDKLVPALRTLAQPQNEFDTNITSRKQDIWGATVIDDLVRQHGWNRARVEPQLASVVESVKHIQACCQPSRSVRGRPMS